MTEAGTCFTAVRFRIDSFCLGYCRNTHRKFSQVDPVVRMRQISTVFTVHFMIAGICLGIFIYVVLFHNGCGCYGKSITVNDLLFTGSRN